MTFDQLKAQVNDTQRSILTAIWDCFTETKQWMLARKLHHDYGKTSVKTSLKQLGGSVVYEFFDSGKYRYQLTLLGILLTERGDEFEELLVKYLQYLRQRFEAEPECETVKSQEVAEALSLSQEQARLLAKLIYASPFHGSGGISEAEWNYDFPSDIDEYPSVTDFRSYLRKHLQERFNPLVPIDEQGRQQFSLSLFHNEKPEKGELEQKFGILLSPGQAVRDFQKLTLSLMPRGLPMTVAFLDIDHFKILNTRYTEKKVDDTILQNFNIFWLI